MVGVVSEVGVIFEVKASSWWVILGLGRGYFCGQGV